MRKLTTILLGLVLASCGRMGTQNSLSSCNSAAQSYNTVVAGIAIGTPITSVNTSLASLQSTCFSGDCQTDPSGLAIEHWDLRQVDSGCNNEIIADFYNGTLMNAIGIFTP